MDNTKITANISNGCLSIVKPVENKESDEQETLKNELVSDGYKLKDYGNYEIYYL